MQDKFQKKKRLNNLFDEIISNKLVLSCFKILTKSTLILIVASIFLNAMSLHLYVKALEEPTHEVSTENIDVNLSKIKNIDEVEDLRTEYSKTYLKENGMYETMYYNEQIHFYKNGIFEEIDNTLQRIEDYYINTNNKYSIKMPRNISDENQIELSYNNHFIKIYYENESEEISLSSDVDRKKKNLKDEAFYLLDNQVSLEYELLQNSIKENVILYSYISDYTYSYFIDTTLRIEKIGNKLFFFDNVTKVFETSEYFMYDSNNQTSYEVSFNIESIDEDTYKVTVTPSDEFLKRAVYPVVIDPEINIIDGGLIDGLVSVHSADYLNETGLKHSVGYFEIANRNNTNSSDDIVGYLSVSVPSSYSVNLKEELNQNQFMYAYLTVQTYSVNVSGDTKVVLSEISSDDKPYTFDTVFEKTYIDEENLNNNTPFNHTFNVYNLLKDKISSLTDSLSYIGFEVELRIDGASNSSIVYNVGGDLTGPKPYLTLGYMNDAGLKDYYTYEGINISDDSTGYIAHNSGNFTYLYNDISDIHLLNLTHIYNDNRKTYNYGYGMGFSINYHEYLEEENNYFKLVDGSQNEVLFYPIAGEANDFVANDGSGDILIIENNEYIIDKKNNERKVYDQNKRLIKAYPNSNYQDTYIDITYTGNLIASITDDLGNKIEFTYTEDDVLLNAKLFRKLSNNELFLYKKIEYIYTNDLLVCFKNITYSIEDSNSIHIEQTSISYDTLNHITSIMKNDVGFSNTYDNLNRVTCTKLTGSEFTNGDFITFDYSINGKRTTVTDSDNKKSIYSFDKYNHTISIENKNGYTTFYKYEDIYYDESGLVISSPEYNKNHKLIVKSNQFKNTINPLTNHGFEIVTNEQVYGWDVGEDTNAYIHTSNYLYGSKVLKVKAYDNIGSVTQEINVENGKTYIVTGYIYNNDTEGAYIDVEGLNGTITKLSNQESVKNTDGFERFEYKFTSNYTGKALVCLKTISNEYVTFDQISVNTNYIDTRYNYLENASFEQNILNSWQGAAGASLITNNGIMPENCGNKTLKVKSLGEINQSINIQGQKDDILVFGGYCFYQNYTGKIKIKLTLTYTDGSTSSNEFVFDQNDINPTYMMAKIKANDNYTNILIEVINESATSAGYIDNMAIYKEGFGVNNTYNTDGNIEEVYNEVTNSTVTYEYYEGTNNIKKVTSNKDFENEQEITYSYDSNNNLVSTSEDNVVSSFEYDSKGNIVQTEHSSSTGGMKSGYLKTTYSNNKLFVIKQEDILGNTTSYIYDEITGLVSNVIFNNDITTLYSYDMDGNVISVTQEGKQITYEYDIHGRVTKITDNDVNYIFIYNEYGDLKEVKINNVTLLTNNYENENSTSTYTSKITSTTYSYGTLSFSYDEENRINKVYRIVGNEEELVLELKYNDYGEIAEYTDYLADEVYYYNYDYQNRLINVNTKSGNNITYTYDDLSRLVNKTNINGISNYGYDSNDKLTSESINSIYNINYSYNNDSFKELSTINFYISNNNVYNKTYIYETKGSYYTGRIKEVTYTLDEDTIKYMYEYDDRSNITSVIELKNNTKIYEETNTYNDLNQLTNQIIAINNTTYECLYFYDENSNLIAHGINKTKENGISAIENICFSEYAFNSQNEMVTQTIGSESISNLYHNIYQTLGRPNLYKGYEFGYNFDNLEYMENGKYRIIYTYNSQGIRTSKQVTNKMENKTTLTKYVLEGNLIIKEIVTGDENYTVNYHYDKNNELVGFTYNNENYSYIKDLQGNINKIVDDEGDVMVEYYYSGYGILLNSIDNSNINLSNINPFRYRGYYQDKETLFYYLNARFYDSDAGRFITMDDISYLGESNTVCSYNLFTYCENNPIMYVDESGHAMTSVLIKNTINNKESYFDDKDERDNLISYTFNETNHFKKVNSSLFEGISNLYCANPKINVPTDTEKFVTTYFSNAASLYVDSYSTRGSGGAAGFGKIVVTLYDIDKYYDAFCIY